MSKHHPELHGNCIENRPTRELAEQFAFSEWRDEDSVNRARAELEARTGSSWLALDGMTGEEIVALDGANNKGAASVAPATLET